MNSQYMVAQADALARYLRGLKQPIYPRSVTPFLAPQLDVFEIEFASDQAWAVDKVLHMQAPFAVLLRVDKEDLRITLQHGCVVVEVPSSRPFIPLAASALTVHPGHVIPIGQNMSGGVVSINLASPNLAHILVVGMTGSGKSEALRTILYQLYRATRSEFVLIDLAGKRRAFADFANCGRRIYPVMYDPDEAGRAIFDLRDDLARQNSDDEATSRLTSRNGGHDVASGEPCAPIWIAIDEVQRLAEHFSGLEAAALLAPFAQRGRAANIHLLLATQWATSWAAGGAFVKVNMGLKLVFRVPDPNAGAYLAGAGSQVDRLRGKGQCLLKSTEALRVQMALTSPADIRDLSSGPPRSPVPGVEDDPPGAPVYANGGMAGHLLAAPKSRQRQFSTNEWLLALQPGISCGMLQVLLRCGGNGASRCRAEAQAWATGLQARGEALPPLQVGAFSKDAQATIGSLMPNEEIET